MRYGICTGFDQLHVLDQLGYDYIELSVTAVMSLDDAQLIAYADKLKSSKVKCEVFNILFPKTMELIGEQADETQLREYLHRAMKRIRYLGGQIAVFGSGKCRRCPEGYDYKNAYRELVEVYRITGEIAAEYGVLIVIEPLSRQETNLICTMAEGAILEADVNHPNVKLLSDYFHVMANHDSISDIKMIGTFGHIHIASGNGRRYPLSREQEQYEAFMEALKAIGYNGRISIEGKTENLEEDAKTALALLKELEAEA